MTHLTREDLGRAVRALVVLIAAIFVGVVVLMVAGYDD